MPASTQSLELLLEVTLLLSSKLDISELLETIMQLSSRVVNAETASLLLVDPKTNELYFDVALGLAPELTKIRLPMGKGIAGACALEGKSLVINDVASDPRWSSTMDKQSGFRTRSILASPMRFMGRTIGVVEAINHIGGGFSSEDIRIFEAFASQAAIAVENARLFASVQEEKTRLDTVFTQMTDGALLTDESGNVTLANGSAVRHFGARVQAGAALNAVFEGLQTKPPLEELMTSPEVHVSFEAVRNRPKPLVLSGTASIVRFERMGRQTATMGRLLIFRDVTTQRHEDALKRSFLSLISHKLKTPLASITGYSQLLMDDLAGVGAPKMKERSLRAILTQGNKLATLVEKLLNFTTLEDLKEQDIERGYVPVDGVLADAEEALKAWIEERKADLKVKAAPGLAIAGDRLLLRDVFKNLIENGVKFSEAGRQVDVWAEPAGPEIAIHVRDHGPGIPPEEQSKIFDKFYQIEANFTGQVDGWGLGLPFVKKVVETHGGRVRLESALGQGTTVTLFLPKGACETEAVP